MAESDIPRDGGCRCGLIRFRITAPPLVTMACHCKECQRMTASAFSLSAAIPTDGFAITAGTPVPGGKSSPELQHFYCPECKSWLFTRMTGMDTFVNVRATLVDAPGDWATPFVEIYTSEKLDWASTPARHSFPQLPPMEAWEGLCRDYTAGHTRQAPPDMPIGLPGQPVATRSSAFPLRAAEQPKD